MTPRFTNLVFLTVAVCAAALTGARAQERPPDNGITVQGTGEIRVKPDIARLQLGVQNQGPDSTRAAAENAAATQKVIDAIKGAGVPDRDIQTSNYAIYPQYDQQPTPAGAEPRPPMVVGYQVNNSVQVTVRKIGDIGKVIDAAVKAGANVAGGIDFDIDDPAPAKEEALRKAVADAVHKGQALADAAKVSNLVLVGIQESTVNYQRPIYPMARGAMAAADMATPISPGENTVTANVTVRFTFSPKRF